MNDAQAFKLILADLPGQHTPAVVWAYQNPAAAIETIKIAACVLMAAKCIEHDCNFWPEAEELQALVRANEQAGHFARVLVDFDLDNWQNDPLTDPANPAMARRRMDRVLR